MKYEITAEKKNKFVEISDANSASDGFSHHILIERDKITIAALDLEKDRNMEMIIPKEWVETIISTWKEYFR